MQGLTGANNDGAGKKKKGGRMNAGAVWAQHDGEATASACIKQQEDKQKVNAEAAAMTAANAQATAVKKKKRQEEEKKMADEVWPLYVEADFKYAALAVGIGVHGHVLSKAKVEAVLLHKFGVTWARREKKPKTAAEWRALLEAKLAKPEVVTMLKAL